MALFLATPLTHLLYERFSTLGISHLFAISGFHLGILSGVIYFILQLLYSQLHSNYFPYRSLPNDLFLATSIVLLGYVFFLEYPPSLVRAYALMVVGFILYTRGIQVIAMQNLAVAVMIILVFFPTLLFSLGFWLSVAGVFYIMLFFIHFQNLSPKQQLFIIPFWVYIMMLPITLYIFGNFSLWHPFSIGISIIFTLFYPVSILLHLIGMGNIFDPILNFLTITPIKTLHIALPHIVFYLYMLVSFLSIFSKKILFIALLYSLFIFLYALFQL
jgi:competence protein ComEC